MANELHFPLFHGYVDRWLVSGVTETPVITKPTALHGRAPRQSHCLARAAGHPARRAGGRRG